MIRRDRRTDGKHGERATVSGAAEARRPLFDERPDTLDEVVIGGAGTEAFGFGIELARERVAERLIERGAWRSRSRAAVR